MKKISVMIPCYNEEENVREIAAAVKEVLERDLPNYDYEILFIDNCSTDATRVYLREMCKNDKKIKAIFNVRNFGQFNSPYYGILQTTGDCTVTMCCDFQDPPELIPTFVKKWEEGYMIVSAIKTASKENPFIYFLRSVYYKMMKKMSDVEMIEQFTGFGLYDKSFVQVLRSSEALSQNSVTRDARLSTSSPSAVRERHTTTGTHSTMQQCSRSPHIPRWA